MSIEEDVKRCKELIKIEHANWIGMSNQSAISNVLAEREQDKKRIQELEEYILIAPDLDEMTATKYLSIQREAYTKGRAEEQQKAEEIINNNYIPKQKVKDKIEEIEEKMKYEDNEKMLIYLHKQRKVLRELLKGEK